MFRRLLALLLVMLTTLPAADVAAQIDWRAVVTALPPLTGVNVQLADGRRLKGTIVATHADGFDVQRHSRYPEAARVVRYDEVVTLERNSPGLSPGMKVTLTAASVFAAIGIVTIAVLSSLD